MNRIVVKFGGSNFKTSLDIDKIINIVKSYNKNLIIIVSAFWGITDKLLLLSEQISDSDKIIEEIIEKYKDFSKSSANFQETIQEKKNELINLVKELKGNPNSIEIKNKIIIFGERLSSSILNKIFNNNNITCKEALPENINLITNQNLQNASISKNNNLKNTSSYFSEDCNYIIPGFYGITETKKIALFGRGGSDYTASIIAYAINAVSLDLWKDVSGFLSADPKIIKNPQKIEALTYLEAAELSYFGAKIIHPGTIRPLLKKNIPLNILNINSTNDRTIISDKENLNSNKIKSITYNNDFVILKLKGSGVGIKKGILRQVTELFDINNINIRSVITSQIEIDFLLHKNDLQNAFKLAKSIQYKNYDIIIEEDISLIACIGNGIKNSHGIAGDIFGALSEKKINIKHIVFGASDVAIYLIVAKKMFKTAINQIHNKVFIETNTN